MVLAAVALVAGACGDDDSADGSDSSTTEATSGSQTIAVPEDHATIQEAVDAAAPG